MRGLVVLQACSALWRWYAILLALVLPCGWSKPGQCQEVRWTKVTDQAGWRPRDSQGELVFQDRMWILGGWYDSFTSPPRDVWSSADGKSWTRSTDSAPWKHSDLPMSIAFGGRMWMMGGWVDGRLPTHSASNQVWASSDGTQWDQVTSSAAWSPRIAAALVEFKGRMILLGGTEDYYFGGADSLRNDVWASSDGKQWTQLTSSAGWSPRAYHQAVVLNDKIYVFGGGNYVPEYHALNDVWCSEDGVHWTQVTAEAPWAPRLWFASAVYRDHMWVLGGWSNNPSKNWGDTWYSKDGKDWKQLTVSESWKERHEHSTFVFQDKLWVAGGHAQPLSSEVWSLQLPKDWSGEEFGSAITKLDTIGHWPLREDTLDHSGNQFDSAGTGLRFERDPKSGIASAVFNGRSSIIQVAPKEALQLGTQEFTVSLWTNIDKDTGGGGDLLSCYDPDSRIGFNLGIYNHGGVTNSQPNTRQLHFGIDQARLEAQFADHGQLGNAVYVFSLCVHAGQLYASTCHAGSSEAGHVYRFEGGQRWKDLGSPDRCNAISAMTVFDGQLYVASAKYRLAGSSLSESENTNSGGKVFKLGPGDVWEPCGMVSSETEAIASLIAYRGKLYASSLYRPAGFFRYEGGQQWTACATPAGKRVEAMTIFQDAIYATSYDEGSVFRYDGEIWETVGRIPNATQTYGLSVYRGQLYVSEWPNAHVYRYAGGTDWVDAGRLGQELEAMPLLVYNGKMYGGTLPLAEVYRYDNNSWNRIGQVDKTPDVKYRRAWSMAVYQGRLFVGTLPSGRVLSIEAGKNVTYDHEFPSGWHHIAAVRGDRSLKLFVDGKQVAESTSFAGDTFNLNCSKPLTIGFGAQNHFRGKIADVQLMRQALSAQQIKQLALESAPSAK